MRVWILAGGMLGIGLVVGLTLGLSLRPGPPSPPEGRSEFVLSRVSRPSDPSPETSSGGPAATGFESGGADAGDAAAGGEVVTDRPDLSVRLREAVRQALATRRTGVRRPEVVEESVDAVLDLLASEHGVAGGAPWILSDADAGSAALRGILTGAGLTLDEVQIRALEGLAERVAPEFLAASDPDREETGRMALRRAAEVAVEGGLGEILHSGQVEALEQALGRRTVVETLPGGEERDTMSSTGVDRARAATMVLSSYQRRLAMAGDPHPGVTVAIDAYVTRVGEINRALRARWGRGFMEAVASGPTPHTEAARRAREEPGHARRGLVARAELWRAQAKLEREMWPYLDDAARALLGTTRPTALRFLVETD